MHGCLPSGRESALTVSPALTTWCDFHLFAINVCIYVFIMFTNSSECTRIIFRMHEKTRWGGGGCEKGHYLVVMGRTDI